MGKEKLQLEIEIAFHWELSRPVGAREESWIWERDQSIHHRKYALENT